MSKLIDADSLKADFKPGRWYRGEEIIDEIEDATAIDAEPVRRGRYIGTEYDGYADGNPVFYEWICSECECVFEDDKPTYKYCPNCGARMDGVEDADD